ncbi:MAG: 1-aminocyclopropane-1-carboxylate deaminase [Hyphomicrobiaceae bacterium]|jgi:1-aminocyclopropane-1-carboxylate deaminase/D-cysteine desulfhydrase-like pyridoxal-dependent ACC family enzyme
MSEMNSQTSALRSALAKHPSVTLGHHPTPIDHLANLSADLGITLLAKRDDCNGLAFGGNKVRQLEYYMGAALATGADTVLVTGAVQSNFVRTTAAAAAKLGLASEVQLEDRVPGTDALQQRSGNVLLSEMLGAGINYFPEGENEAAADAALDVRAAELRAAGRKPYVFHLGSDHEPTGGLGYAACAAEILEQLDGDLPDAVVIPSGSGLTHAGFLVGARACGWDVPVIGICVRRDAGLQRTRIGNRARQIASLLDHDDLIQEADVIIRDDVLAPGYGQLNDSVTHAIDITARREALFLDPVYSGRTVAGLIDCLNTGVIQPGSKALMIHTGGNPGVFAYQSKLATVLDRVNPVA